ncbi:hypothetical protein [Candidatus Uabimicrobium sp. HlEnr_7]|uniref:hypothetical protein n=1 Tax=Candidatus Uabimicrobium helgolandensis TaxID=3095367 RepID=UPI003556B08C
MPLKIRCSCGAILLAPEERIGQTGKCPSCNRSIAVDLSMSKTQEIMHKLELEKTQRMEQHQLNSTQPTNSNIAKKSIIHKILTLLIYVVFFGLVTGTLFLHYSKDIRNINVNNSTMKDLWQNYKEPLHEIREIHRAWYSKMTGKKTKSKKPSIYKPTSKIHEAWYKKVILQKK